MSKNHEFGYRTMIIMLSVILIFTLVQSPTTTQAAPLASGAPMLAVTVFDVYGGVEQNVTSTYENLLNFGTFTVNSADSLLELTFNGRIWGGSFSSSTGLIFELRVDSTPSSIGRARTNLRSYEVYNGGMPVSFTGMFEGLTVGDHTASMWVRTSTGTAGVAIVNPDGWETDVLIIKEYLPFGFAYMPLINK